MDVFAGRCYCGNIRFEVRTRPETETLALFCHCESCRRAHAAPLYAVVYIPSVDFRILEGEESLQAFCKDPPNGVIRSFCKLCGSRVCNTWAPGVRKAAGKEDIGTGFFPALLDDAVQHSLPPQFRATSHHCSEETIMGLADLVPLHRA